MKASLIIILIIGTFSILTSQGGIEYIKGAVSCNVGQHSHDLKVFLAESFDQEKLDVPILGDFDFIKGKRIFTPILPFQIGQHYIATCRSEILAFQVPIPDSYIKPSVKAIYPSDDTLPSNLLKFHVKFSRPMSRIGYTNVELSDESGKTIERALLKEIPELWNDEHTQLTIWIEPGRIKRGLGPNVELGPVLEKNKAFTLFVSGRFRDENGVELDQNYTKNFVAGAADREKLNIDDVLINYYQGDKFDNISLKFAEAVDLASSISNLKVIDSSKSVIAGSWELTDGEREAVFASKSKLKKGHYEVLLNSVIEDLAGNNFLRNFDQEVGKKQEKELKKQFFLSFKVN